MSKYVRIIDIAKKLDLAPSSVSRALDDHYSISPKTKKKVNELAHKLGYQRNLHAISMKSKKSSLIGLLLPDFTSYFLYSLIEVIKNVLETNKYNLVVMQSGSNHNTEVVNLQRLYAMRVDGILYSPTIETPNAAHLESSLVNNVPVVNFDRDCGSDDFFKVLVDDEYGAFCAVQHLVDVGCRRIAHISGPKTVKNAQNRSNGYKRALMANGIEFLDELVVESDFSIDNSIHHIKKLLELDPKPDGIFAVNDATALGCMSVIKGIGLDIPNDIAVIGYDDETYSQYLNPSLSTVKHPIFDMGELSAQLCLDQINNKGLLAGGKTVLKPKLIVRQSSKKGAYLHYA